MPPDSRQHTTNELLRKSLHIAFGLVAFTLKWLTWEAAAAVCVVAIAGNWLLLHRLVGRGVARHERGYDAGIVLYPVAVLLLILTFRHQLHFAAIGWTLLAFGDGFATLAGRRFPAKLPWNRDKSWAGLLAFFIAGSVASIAVGEWLGYDNLYVILIAALAAAITESLPLRIDDNLTVPFAAAIALIVADIPVMSAYGVWPSAIRAAAWRIRPSSNSAPPRRSVNAEIRRAPANSSPRSP